MIAQKDLGYKSRIVQSLEGTPKKEGLLKKVGNEISGYITGPNGLATIGLYTLAIGAITTSAYLNGCNSNPNSNGNIVNNGIEYHQPAIQDTTKYSPFTNTDYILTNADGTPLKPKTF